LLGPDRARNPPGANGFRRRAPAPLLVPAAADCGGARAVGAVETEKVQRFRRNGACDAAKCSAAVVGILLAAFPLSCRTPAAASSARVHAAPAPDAGAERSCAWFGDVSGPVLYFGVSAFWSALRAAGGDALADLREPGPRWIGRFDLASERFLPPLDLRPAGAATGVWDVLAHPNGRVYYTTYFDFAGSVDPASGEVQEFPAAGLGLNELALGADGSILVTRYGFGTDSRGSLVVLSESGAVLAEHALTDPPGRRAAAKSLAFDPLRREVWVNTDLFALDGSAAVPHDARVLGPDGHERRLVADPELEFFVFAPDGTGLFAEASEGRLRLRERSPRGLDRFVALDDAFDAAHDFAQELRIEPDGSVLVTRWSGRIHVIEPTGEVRDLALPQSPGDLYYTAARRGERICATRCGGIEVVCADLPAP
jgi:hypothetical protein